MAESVDEDAIFAVVEEATDRVSCLYSVGDGREVAVLRNIQSVRRVAMSTST